MFIHNNNAFPLLDERTPAFYGQRLIQLQVSAKKMFTVVTDITCGHSEIFVGEDHKILAKFIVPMDILQFKTEFIQSLNTCNYTLSIVQFPKDDTRNDLRFMMRERYILKVVFTK